MNAHTPASPDPLLSGDVSATLATRYRPKSFATLTGQQHVTKVLRQALADRQVPQQLLFSGGSGLGKTTVARILAAALLCEAPMGTRDRADACGKCESCLDVLTPGRHHPDVIEFDAASNGGKDEIREIAARAQLVPLRGPVKVYIIDEAHGLSGAGGQAFLKLLEEPPAHVVFMLCTTDPQKMLKTNRGRCVEFELLTPNRNELVANLQRVCTAEGWSCPEHVLDIVLGATDTDLGVRGTLMTLAKLSGPLIAGGAIDDDVVADLLGVAPQRLVAAVFSALDAADPLGVLDALADLRSRVSEERARTALLSTARERWRAALAQGTPQIAQRRYELLAGAPAGEEHTELVLVRLARPALDAPGTEEADAILERATAMLDDLTRTTAEARSVGAKLVDTIRSSRGNTAAKPKPASRPAKPATEPTPSRPVRLTGPSVAPPATPKRTGMPAPVAPGRLSPAAAQLIAAASPAPAALAAFLTECTVSIGDDGVTVEVPVTLKDRLTPLEQTLRAAAGRLGLPLKLV